MTSGLDEHRQKIHFNIFAPRQKKNKNKIVSTVKTKKSWQILISIRNASEKFMKYERVLLIFGQC